MADQGLQERIIKLLSGKPKKKETLAKIIQTFRVPKKSLNIQLYRLQRQGRVVRIQESPPIWALPEGASCTALAPRATRSSQKSLKSDEVDVQLEKKILDYLRKSPNAKKSLEIAKATGYKKAHDVNMILYTMQEKGLINKVTEKPPSWTIASDSVRSESSVEDGAAFKLEPCDRGEATASFPTSGPGIPVFQDVELFNTVVKTECNKTDFDKFTNDGGDEFEDDEEREEVSKSKFLKGGTDQSQSILREGSPIEGLSDTSADITTQGTYKLFEKSADSDMFEDNSNLETVASDKSLEYKNQVEEAMDTNSSGLDSLKYDENNAVLESFSNSCIKTNEFVNRDTEDERVRNKLFHETPDFDKSYIEKPRTFRDVFKLDDPMSDEDTSSSFDSAKNINAELSGGGDSNDSMNVKEFAECQNSANSLFESTDRKGTPEINVVTEEMATPEQFGVQRVWDTPQMLDSVLDLQEDVAAGSINDEVTAKGEKSFLSDKEEREADGSKLKFVESSQSEFFVQPTHALEAKDEISQVEMNEELTDVHESIMKFSDDDMRNCDKVLEVLMELKAMAQFVLKRKTDIPPENLDEVLQKCLSMNFVSGNAKLWKITEEGMSYISKKTGKNDINESEQIMEQDKRVKPSFKGPPPSPMALLGRKPTHSSRETVIERLSEQNASGSASAFTSHSPDSLFRPPSSYSCPKSSLLGTSSVTKSRVLDKSDNGPKPLMSVNTDSNSLNKPKFQSGLNSSLVCQGTIQPLMSIKFDQSPVGMETDMFPQHGSITVQSNRDRFENSTQVASVQNFAETAMRMRQSPQNQQTLTNNSWGSGAFSEGASNVKPQVSDSCNSSKQLTRSSLQGLQRSTHDYQNSVNQSQSSRSPQKQRNTTVGQESQLREIPSKYADYPNQSTSLQCLKNKTQSKSVSKSAPVGTSKSAFNKGPPPTPIDILSKGLKKTEISPPSSFRDNISVSLPSGSFSTVTQTSKTAGTWNQVSENKSVFSDRQFEQTCSQISLNAGGKRREQSLIPASFTQSGSVFRSQNNQTGFQTFSANQSGSTLGGSSARSTGGPPPPPAVKLGLEPAQSMPAPVTIPRPAQSALKPNLSLALNTESFKALNKNPVSALMEYAQSRKLVARVEVLSRRGSSHKPTFEMAAFVGDRKFPSVTCHNKKEGRKEACDIAMRQLVAEGQFQAEASNTTSISPVPSANMTHFDTIAALTHRGFTALVSQITAESFAGRKVIAGLVMKRSADDTGVLISLGTGNRCITGPQLSLQGNTVNDSHAEIITRRGFLRFLYKQLLDFNPIRPHPMFEKLPSGKLRIRPNITFHLYISTAPCGDGALFSPRDAESCKAPVDTRIRPSHEPIFTSNVQGLLRTKVEGGEGTIPIEPGFKGQTFDGIQRGERLRTMSCTDKICRWNVVGMQGALLSHFLEPIYLDSLTLGLLYDHGHLSRAVCCRVGRGQVDVNTELPPGYQLNHPWLGRVTVCDPPREVQKTKALSINWCFGDSEPEVTDGTLGLCYTSIEKGFFSRCSKRNLFSSFKALCEKFGRQDLLQVSSYNEAKVVAQDFVSAKQVMLKRFKENGFGKWVSKPVEEEMFGFDDEK